MMKRISKGYQITIPAEIRKRFDLGIGTPIDIEVQNEKIILKPFDVKKEMERLFKESEKFKHSLSAEDLEKMEEDLYG